MLEAMVVAGRWMGLWAIASQVVGCGARSALEADDGCVITAEVELCDGIDNDCDGRVDEDIPAERCGEHGCEVEVRCEGGVMLACVPKAPVAESCNLQDDDCDGEVDEGFGFGPLGAIVTLRQDEFDTGGCSTCNLAFGVALAPVGDGFRALWNLGLSGGNEQPTLFGRSIDPFGIPTTEIVQQLPDFLLEIRPMAALEPLPPGGVPIEAIYRVGFDDLFGMLLSSSSGELTKVVSTPSSGPRGVPRTVWTGERFVSAWEQDDALHVAVLAPDGSLEGVVEVDALDRPAAITLGVYPGRVGILVSRYRDDPERRDQWFLLLDDFGNVEAPARQVDVEYTTWQRLVGTGTGWLHIRPNGYEEPSTRQVLDVAGDPLGEALVFEDGRSLQDSGLQSRYVPRPGLGETLAAWQGPSGGDMHVEWLDDRGDVLRGWAGALPNDPGTDVGYFVQPHVIFVADRLLLAWHGVSEGGLPNRVSVQEFGCVP
jgi:Putative metal-binding motif